MDLILVQLQQLQEFVDDIRIRQEVPPFVGAVEEVGCLDFLEHGPDLVLDLRCNRGWGVTVQSRQNVSSVFIIPVPPKLFEDFTDILFSQESDIVDSALPDLANHFVHHIFWDLRAFLRLELVQDLVEMVLLLVCIIVALLRRITETGEIRDNEGILFRSALGAYENTFGCDLFPWNITRCTVLRHLLDIVGVLGDVQAVRQTTTRKVFVKHLFLRWTC